MIARSLAGLALALVGACASTDAARLSSIRFAPIVLPVGVERSNADLAADFLDLTFALESGEQLERLLRYEEPIRVRLASPSLETYRPDLEALLARLRAEAGIDIAETTDAAGAQINIEMVPAAELARVFPSAACFIVPGETSWRGFLQRRNDARQRWSARSTLGRAAIFLPSDTTPQDVRDCLHEEITQALGPANDLYRLPDSIWNDDNLHGMATPFDMLVLRVLYQPELRSGMTRKEVAARLPRLLDRENPEGRRLAPEARHAESRAWATAIERALSQRTSRDERLTAARLATQIAAEMQPPDHRLSVSLLTLGRLTLRRDPAAAAQYFGKAYQQTLRRHGPQDVRAAHAGVHVAAIALASGRYETVVKLVDLHAPAATKGQNAILLAGLLSLKAEALLGLGADEEALQVRLDSLRWARYGFGDNDGALAREQAALVAMSPAGGS